jgi:hypothetical protein
MLSTPQRKITSVLFSASLIITLIPLQSTAINAAGPAITTSTTTAVPTILNGKTPPTTSLGKNGDFYIDTKNLMFYGPKKNGSWPLGLSMKGEAGKDGVDGKNGVDGKDGKNGIDGAIGKTGATGVAGPTGATGLTGATGPIGATGATGLTGAVGATGAKGETGAAGIAGAKGDTGAVGPTGPAGATGPQGLQGIQGEQGIPGAKGDTGATGPAGATGAQGVQGATGATGSAGISRAFFGSIQFGSPLSSSASSSAISSAFGSFAANSNYVVRLVIIGAYQSTADDLPFQLNIASNGGTANISYGYSMANVKSSRSGAVGKEVNFQVEVLIDGSNSSSGFNLVATVSHESVGLGTVSLSGSYLATQVGSAS